MGSFHRGDGRSVAESSEGKHILRSVDQVGVARNERKNHLSKSEHPKGAMGKGLVACLVASCRTHRSRYVGVDLARLEDHGATHDVNTTSLLPNKGGTSVKASTPSGRWRNFQGEFERRALT
jgi:hypothetical protein